MNENAKATSFDLYVKAPSGTEAALHVELSDLEYLPALVEGMKDADQLLREAGFVRSERLDRPVYPGGGAKQQRPQTPPPAGVVVWEHCGQPAKYVRYKKDGAKPTPAQKARGLVDGEAEMWACSRDKQCEDVTSGKRERCAVSFDMKLTAQQEAAPAPATTPAPAAQGGAAPAPRKAAGAQTISRFWETAKALGFNTKDVLAIAKVPGIQGFTAEELHSLHDHMKAIQRGQAVGDWSRAA